MKRRDEVFAEALALPRASRLELAAALLESAPPPRVEAALNRALDAPLALPKHPVDGRFRRVLVTRFPYALASATLERPGMTQF